MTTSILPGLENTAAVADLLKSLNDAADGNPELQALLLTIPPWTSEKLARSDGQKRKKRPC